MENFISQLLEFLNVELTVLFTSALPLIELRGAIPVGIALGMSPLHATLLSLVGSMIPVPFILFTIRPIFNYLKETKMFNQLVHKLTHRSMSKSGRIQKYGVLGLILFVGIPLPGTGVWSGSLAASLLDMRFKYAFPAILIGNIIAAILIMTLSSGVFELLK
jgi:uncharacterized membrane protein